MGMIYINTTFKPKRKSSKTVKKVVKSASKEFIPLKIKMPTAYRTNNIPSLNSNIDGIVATPQESYSYSGERKLLGIGVLHKSCLQPIFNEHEAVEIAQMRR